LITLMRVVLEHSKCSVDYLVLVILWGV